MPRFPAAHSILTDAIRDHAFPGAAYGILFRGEMLAMESAGRFTYDANSPPISPETIFDIASITKVLATTAMAMSLYDDGRLDLDEPVHHRSPVFVQEEPADSSKRMVTARMLLAHTSGLPAYARLFEYHRAADDLLSACLRMPLETPPETRTVYSDIGFIILGLLLETIADEPIDQYGKKKFFDPLGMNSTFFRPPEASRSAIPPTGFDTLLRHRFLQGEVHDDNCFVLGGVSSHAGLFSSVADILRFADCVLNSGASLFRTETIHLFARRHSDADPTSRALGWDMPSQPSSSGHFFSPSSIGHLGYTGTSLWIDLEKQLAVALLTNRTLCDDDHKADFNKIRKVRPAFHDAILRELGFAAASVT